MALRSFAIVYLGFLLLAPLLAWAQRRTPAGEPTPFPGADRRTDWLYWLYTPLVTGTLTRAVTLGGVGIAAWSLGFGIEGEGLLALFRSHSLVARHAVWVQVVEALVVADLAGYWTHRLRHLRGLWPIHAVHHSARTLDWLAAARMHTLDDLIDNTLVGLVILLMGFDLSVFAALGPLLLLTTLLIHADLRWNFGRLRYVLVSPTYHRWHHAASGPSVNKNFAEMFPIFDLLFGTLYLPAEKAPTDFGAPGEAIPESLTDQQLYPFRKWLSETNSDER